MNAPILQLRRKLLRLWFFRVVCSRLRLFLSGITGIAVGFALPESLAHLLVTRILVAWNAGTILYIVLTVVMMWHSSG